jgi:hypothetical protein
MNDRDYPRGSALEQANYNSRESLAANRLSNGLQMTKKATAAFSMDSESFPRHPTKQG